MSSRLTDVNTVQCALHQLPDREIKPQQSNPASGEEIGQPGQHPHPDDCENDRIPPPDTSGSQHRKTTTPERK